MRCEMGLWPATAPTGYLNEKRIDRKGYVKVDSQRAPVIKKMFEKMAYDKWSGRKIYHWLKFDMNFTSATSNKPLTLSNIFRLLQTPFYYGEFEYPVGSGKWYKGRHQPIITKELYDKTQEQLKRDKIVRGESKEFAFTKLMTCGLCGSGISAEEKYKKLKTNGLTVRYVYYGCTRSRDLHCKNGYIREEELIRQLVELIDKLEINQGFIKKKFKKENQRINKFQKAFLGIKRPTKVNSGFDPKMYATYVLQEGTAEEKRELLGTMENKIILEEKKVRLK